MGSLLSRARLSPRGQDLVGEPVRDSLGRSEEPVAIDVVHDLLYVAPGVRGEELGVAPCLVEVGARWDERLAKLGRSLAKRRR